METKETLLLSLNETVARLLGIYENLPDADILVYELWSAKDVLAHLTFWHESFARNVSDLKPKPLKGRLADLNQSGVDAMRAETLETVLNRFKLAHNTIQMHILNPTITLIPYKQGSRNYSPEEHLEIVSMHIKEHLGDVQKKCAALIRER